MARSTAFHPGGGRVVVLCYHSVHPSSRIASATPAAFEAQLDWLQERCEVVPFDSVLELPNGTRERPSVAITFDDGYEDNHRYAFPALRDRGLTATFFLTTGLLDGESHVVRRFASLWQCPESEARGMTWEQVREIHEAGHMIGAHTQTHPSLASMPALDARSEIERSKVRIEERLDDDVALFAYPFGKPDDDVSAETSEIARSVGFRSAATILYRGVRPGDDRMRIPRFPVTGDTLEVFIGKIEGRLDGVGLWQAFAPGWMSDLLGDQPSRPIRSSAPPADGSLLNSTATASTTDEPPSSLWIGLPWSRSPRWYLPQGSSLHAKGGLSIYQPITLRSRMGWEVGRVMASLGVLSTFRASSLIPREVWEAAGPIVPPGGTISVSRANHPGRFQALVLDRAGRPTRFVKVARDSVGAFSLERERESLERFSRQLQWPLFAPSLLASSTGVLIFEAEDWRPRSMPWRLPEEVAFAIGAFYRETSSAHGQGVAHGDFAPWNLLRVRDGWSLIDWESVVPGAPPYYDLFHYFIQSLAGLHRPTMRSILDGLEGSGWVGEAVEAYAAGSGIDASESRRFLREYLRASSRRLGPLTFRRQARMRSRMMEQLER